jgi:hypothetical protein
VLGEADKETTIRGLDTSRVRAGRTDPGDRALPVLRTRPRENVPAELSTPDAYKVRKYNAATSRLYA